jgi:membrane protein
MAEKKSLKERFQSLAKRFQPKIQKVTDWLNKQALFKMLKETFANFGEHRVMKMSAALSYYTIFSLPAMMVIIIGLSSIIFGQEIVEGKVFRILNDYIGDQTAMQLQSMLRQTTVKGANVWATIIGAITLLLSAAGIFGEIQDSLNLMWGLKPKPKKGMLQMLVNRLMSFSMLLVLAFILLVSLVLTTVIETFLNFLAGKFSQEAIKIFSYVNYVVILAAVSTLFMFIFKFLPDGKVRWKDAYVGALVTAVLFVLGKFGISLYLSNMNFTAYGGTASLAVLLVWVYYSSIIMYLGAEFTQAFAAVKGRYIEPKKFAVRVVTEKKEKPPGKLKPAH